MEFYSFSQSLPEKESQKIGALMRHVATTVDDITRQGFEILDIILDDAQSSAENPSFSVYCRGEGMLVGSYFPVHYVEVIARQREGENLLEVLAKKIAKEMADKKYEIILNIAFDAISDGDEKAHARVYHS